MPKIKELGQYMTPDGIVNMILDGVGFTGEEAKTIMEPAFGDGAFLVNIATRIIEARKVGLERISEILNDTVYGFEIDGRLYEKAISKLNRLLSAYNIPQIPWTHLYNEDAILGFRRFSSAFDYVVGNPPFVRIHNMDERTRAGIKRLNFSKGMADMYIAFYEIGIEMLNDSGRLGFISPNSFMKNTSQRDFRNYLIPYITGIYDFKNSKIFKGVNTYTCICLLDKNKKRTDFVYREYSMYEKLSETVIDSELLGPAWNLGSEDDMRFLEENKNRPIKINNIAIVQNGVATNRDSVYIHSVYLDRDCTQPYTGKHTDREKTVWFRAEDEAIPIESTILHRCIKASRYNGVMENTYIIFPYKTTQCAASDGRRIEPFEETELKERFPKAYNYLCDELCAKDGPWFAFGRSQGLRNSGYKKIVFKHVTTEIKPYIVDEDVIVYSGMYTTIDANICMESQAFNEQMYDAKLQQVFDIFSTNEFSRYCALVGKDMSSGYVGISTQMVKHFGVKAMLKP